MITLESGEELKFQVTESSSKHIPTSQPSASAKESDPKG
jgi:hypothetical protein